MIRDVQSLIDSHGLFPALAIMKKAQYACLRFHPGAVGGRFRNEVFKQQERE